MPSVHLCFASPVEGVPDCVSVGFVYAHIRAFAAVGPLSDPEIGLGGIAPEIRFCSRNPARMPFVESLIYMNGREELMG